MRHLNLKSEWVGKKVLPRCQKWWSALQKYATSPVTHSANCSPTRDQTTYTQEQERLRGTKDWQCKHSHLWDSLDSNSHWGQPTVSIIVSKITWRISWRYTKDWTFSRTSARAWTRSRWYSTRARFFERTDHYWYWKRVEKGSDCAYSWLNFKEA